MSEEEVDTRPLRDDMAFDDPAAWGFCEMCAFDVAVTKGDGIRIEHRRIRNGHEDALCTGSNKAPLGPTPAHAVARKQISMRKDPNRAQRRAHWQRRRWHAREQAAEEKAIFHNQRSAAFTLTVNPDRVEITDPETGVTSDITERIIGPVRLEMDDGDHYD